MIIKPENRIFIHIPKTGGTSITTRYIQKYDMIRRTKLGTSNHPFIIFDDSNRVTKTEWHFTYDRAFMQFPNFEYFTVIRNPLDRWISVYKHFYMRRLIKEGIEQWTEKTINKLPAVHFEDGHDPFNVYQSHKFIHPQWMYYREPEVKVFTINSVWKYANLQPQHIKRGVEIRKFNRNIIKEMIYNYYKKDFERWQMIESKEKQQS